MASRVVATTSEFEKEVRQLQRKYPGVKTQVRRLIVQLMDGELPGNRVPQSYAQTFKVRLPNPAARRGKRGGFRVYYVLYNDDQAYLIPIYSKTVKNDASVNDVRQRILRIQERAGNEDFGKK